jgi:hypothetical protein
MLLTLIFASIGVAYTILTVVAAFFGEVSWTNQWWIPALIIGFEVVGAAMTRRYVNAPPVPYRHSTEGTGDLLGNASPGVLVAYALALLALTVGAIPVWLVARVRAKRDGIDLGFLAAYQIGAGRQTH